MKIFQSTYKDIEAITCVTKSFSATFLPKYGAKLTSLKDRYTEREFLAQAPGSKYKRPCYDGNYAKSECSAFDDMFPTIDSFICTEYPWNGVAYPDHGEVYALSWAYEYSEDCLHLWVYSVRFGYRLDKWITEQGQQLCIRYQVQNLTGFDFNYIYAAHCMLAVEEGTTIDLPYPEASSITTIFSQSGRLGQYGEKGHWPCNHHMDFSQIPPKKAKETDKFFFDSPAPSGSCSCCYPDQSKLIFQFDHQNMPYLGIWINAGGFKDMYNVAFEPCTGSFDRPDIAKLHSQHSILGAHSSKEWFLSFELSSM